MKIRTVLIFPEFDNMSIIDGIRDKYDPLARLIRPHITLVFPFESGMDTETLKSRLQSALIGTEPFDIELRRISKHIDRWGNYLFLSVVKGKQQLAGMSRSLYLSLFGAENTQKYIPHITVGKLETEGLLDSAYSIAAHISDTFTAVADAVSVEIIGAHGESYIEMEYRL